MDREHSRHLLNKNEELKAVWEEYSAAKNTPGQMTPYELLKRVQVIVKPQIVFEEYYYEDPEITADEDEPAEQPEIHI